MARKKMVSLRLDSALAGELRRQSAVRKVTATRIVEDALRRLLHPSHAGRRIKSTSRIIIMFMLTFLPANCPAFPLAAADQAAPSFLVVPLIGIMFIWFIILVANIRD